VNVLFVTNSLGFGGAEKMVIFVAESLSARGHAVSIANLNYVPDYVNLHRRAIDEKISVYEAGEEQKHSAKGKLSFVLDVAKRENSDVVIGFTGIPNVIARIVGFMRRIPAVMSERGDPARTGVGRGTLKNRIVFRLINGCKGGVFQTEGARDFYGKGLRKRGIVIPNPIFIKGELPTVSYGEREKTVVSVGRLDNFQKRYDIMLDAFKLFSEKHPEYVLKLYGKGNDEELIRTWVDDRGLDGKVLFMGLTTQPMQDIARDGVFLITSDFEGISNSLLEAMAVGLPCVSTDHTPGGARLLITDHENGLLAPIEDAVALSNAMCEFAENPALAKACGEKARDVVNRFAPDQIIDMWEQYLLKLCKSSR